MAVYYKSVNNCITAMCYGLVVQLVSTVDKILTDSISPGSSAVTELLVPLWYRLTRVVLEKGCETCVWATVNVCVCLSEWRATHWHRTSDACTCFCWNRASTKTTCQARCARRELATSVRPPAARRTTDRPASTSATQ